MPQPQWFHHGPPWLGNGVTDTNDEETEDASDEFSRVRDNLNNATYQAVEYMMDLLQSINSMEMRLSVLETGIGTSTATANGDSITTGWVFFDTTTKPDAQDTSSSAWLPSPTTTLTVKPITVNGSISMSSYTTVFSFFPPTPVTDGAEITSTTTVTSRSIIRVTAPTVNTISTIYKSTSPSRPIFTSSQATSAMIHSRSTASESTTRTRPMTRSWSTTLTPPKNTYTITQWVTTLATSVMATRSFTPESEPETRTGTFPTSSRSTAAVHVTTTVSGCLDETSSSAVGSMTTVDNLNNPNTMPRFTHTRVGIPVTRSVRVNSTNANSFRPTTLPSRYSVPSAATTTFRSNSTRRGLLKLRNSLTYITTVPSSVAYSASSAGVLSDTGSTTTSDI